MQLLEAIDLGGIISKIKQLPSWKNKIDRKSIFRDSAINESLETYYNTFFMVARESEYLKSSIFSKLTEKIGLAMAYVNQDSKILLEETLLKVRDSIQTNDFKDNLASELAWAMLTSYLFIVSKEQYGTRKAYLDALICLWYKLFQSNHELQVTRLFETCYYLNVKFSGLGEGYCIPKNCKLKPESDLCDGEMIHYAYCGLKTNDVGQRIPVTGITFDCAQTIEQRRNVIRQVMTDLQRDVE